MNRVNDTERKYIIFLYFFPAKYNGAFSHNCTPQSERTSIPAPFIWERKKMGRNVNWHPEKKYTWILWGNLKKKRNENWHKLYDVYLPLVRLCTSMNSRNDIFGQRMPGVDIVYYIPYLFYHLKLLTADEL